MGWMTAGRPPYHLLCVMRTILLIKTSELQVIVDTPIDEMSKCRDLICNLENSHSSPEFIGLIDSEACVSMRQFSLLGHWAEGNSPSVFT